MSLNIKTFNHSYNICSVEGLTYGIHKTDFIVTDNTHLDY